MQTAVGTTSVAAVVELKSSASHRSLRPAQYRQQQRRSFSVPTNRDGPGLSPSHSVKKAKTFHLSWRCMRLKATGDSGSPSDDQTKAPESAAGGSLSDIPEASQDAATIPRQQRQGPGRQVAYIVTFTALLGVCGIDPSPFRGGINVIGGATFLAGFIASLAGSLLSCHLFLPVLQRLKAGQVVRSDGPQSHISQKTGTPTMGGIFFIPVPVVTALVLSGFAADVAAVGVTMMCFAAIGLIDDWKKLTKQSSGGLRSSFKLALQVAVGCAFSVWVHLNSPESAMWTAIPLIATWQLPIGPLYWALSVFAMAAESNGVNLTDGLDGLAASTSIFAFLGLAAAIAPSAAPLALFCTCVAGALIGFLYHNHHPAALFMGDTGSLALGGGLGATAVAAGPSAILPLFIASLLFAFQSVSVILQVGYYKATKGPDGKGRRLFRMAPYHHHLELGGWSEVQVVRWFSTVGAILAVLAVVVTVV
mmetsp:Transcript_6661/g.7648  ORF Transcript_6661/g.7648 Transcript_6661/m.7648 type:complete len:477 (-) Transcript_6661:100-1530(-)|eukprot:CAMPEP_0197862798 /NCGR_PEP_ID=MMETSP1438-20131217/39801_1 /TAXON_ID=1461541 /ORGANISM="Pterosperma sp., Strain CCMP1384" /LENGTH=476 /DNA_ID=CAMNT_0043480467 /DNA_START=205 /DNA_END=1635 /DNA_ORIENTATION=-